MASGGDILLSLGVKPAQAALTLNSRVDGKWQRRETAPLPRGAVSLSITVTATGYIVSDTSAAAPPA